MHKVNRFSSILTTPQQLPSLTPTSSSGSISRRFNAHFANTHGATDNTQFLRILSGKVRLWFDALTEEQVFHVVKSYKSYPLLGTRDAIMAQVKANTDANTVKGGEAFLTNQANHVASYISACELAHANQYFTGMQYPVNWTQLGDTEPFREVIYELEEFFLGRMSEGKELFYWKAFYATIDISKLLLACNDRMLAACHLISTFSQYGKRVSAGSDVGDGKNKFSTACLVYTIPADKKVFENSDKFIGEAVIPDFRMFLLQRRKDMNQEELMTLQGFVVENIKNFMRAVGSQALNKYVNSQINLGKIDGKFTPFVLDYFASLREYRASLRNLIRELTNSKTVNSRAVYALPNVIYPK
jgi:hypothetical protein